MTDTLHFCDMLKERGISREWIIQAMEDSDRIENHDDGTRHYLKQIAEHGNRWLRVVVNIKENPDKKVTAFFDRRLRRG